MFWKRAFGRGLKPKDKRTVHVVCSQACVSRGARAAVRASAGTRAEKPQIPGPRARKKLPKERRGPMACGGRQPGSAAHAGGGHAEKRGCPCAAATAPALPPERAGGRSAPGVRLPWREARPLGEVRGGTCRCRREGSAGKDGAGRGQRASWRAERRPRWAGLCTEASDDSTRVRSTGCVSRHHRVRGKQAVGCISAGAGGGTALPDRRGSGPLCGRKVPGAGGVRK